MRCSFLSTPSPTPLQSSPCKGRVPKPLCRGEEDQGGLQEYYCRQCSKQVSKSDFTADKHATGFWKVLLNRRQGIDEWVVTLRRKGGVTNACILWIYFTQSCETLIWFLFLSFSDNTLSPLLLHLLFIQNGARNFCAAFTMILHFSSHPIPWSIP